MNIPHIIIPPDQWPRSRVYYFCPDCQDVFGIPKADPADCPQCGSKGLKDIFTEIAELLETSSSLRPGGVEPDLTTRGSTLAYFNSLPWRNNPYSACGRIGHALDLHMARQRQVCKESFDESYHYVKELVDDQYQAGKGYWGGQEADFISRTSGNMKILCTYARFDWPIPESRRIIDYHLSGAAEKDGFEGSGCSAFNQMHLLCCIFGQYPELRQYRGDEIDRYAAKTFLTFLGNWSDETNFYGETWLSKHNHGVVPFMTALLLDLPISWVSTIYNWRENPIITRNEDGTIVLSDYRAEFRARIVSYAETGDSLGININYGAVRLHVILRGDGVYHRNLTDDEPQRIKSLEMDHQWHDWIIDMRNGTARISRDGQTIAAASPMIDDLLGRNNDMPVSIYVTTSDASDPAEVYLRSFKLTNRE